MAALPGKEELYDRILARSKGRFLFIAQQYAPAGEAADLFQEIQVQLWAGLDRFKGRASPETWAYRVALNTASVHRRNRDRRDRARRAYTRVGPPGQRAGRGEEQILQEFAESLPEDEHSVFTLFLTNLSYPEIAEITGIAEPTLRVKISRIRQQFEQRYL